MRRVLLITLLAALAPCADAQRMINSSPRFAARFNRGGHPRSSFVPLAYADPFYADYLSSTGYPVASQPPMNSLQAPPADARREPVSAPVQPLMIELQGDRYVRVSGPEMPGAEMIERMPDPSPSTERASSTVNHAAAPELPPAVLVFRDGHREEAAEYTIADGVIYTHADYYSTGSWNKKIELSSLNLPETIQSNQSRGVRFQLPAYPNEVIVRP